MRICLQKINIVHLEIRDVDISSFIETGGKSIIVCKVEWVIRKYPIQNADLITYRVAAQPKKRGNQEFLFAFSVEICTENV